MLGHSPLQACRNSQPIVIDDISKLKGGTFYALASPPRRVAYTAKSQSSRVVSSGSPLILFAVDLSESACCFAARVR